MDSLVLDHLKLTDSSRELGSLRETLRLIQAESDQAKAELESQKAAHQESLEKAKANLESQKVAYWEALDKQRDLEARLALTRGDLLRAQAALSELRTRISVCEEEAW